MNDRGIRTIAALAMVTACAQGAHAADDPGAICLAGLVPNTIINQSHGDSNLAFRTAYCGDWNTDHNNDSGGSLGVVFEEIPIQASGHSTSKSTSHTQFCSDKSLSTSSSYQIAYWSSTVPESARAGFYHCVENAQNRQSDGSAQPLRVKATATDDAVIVNVSWDANSRLPAPAFGDMMPENVICPPSSTMRRGQRIPVGEGADLSCRWTSDLIKTGYVIVSTTKGLSQHAAFLRPEVQMGTASVTTSHNEQKIVASPETCSTPPSDTPWLHNRPIQAFYLTIHAAKPPVSWRQARLECLVDHDGSCSWNGIPSNSGFTVVENTPDHFKILKPIGSLAITIRACATEDELQLVPVPTTGPEQPILRNTNISYLVASGQTAVIHYKATSGAATDIPVGTTSSPFYLVNSTDTPGGRSFTYLLRETPPQAAIPPHLKAARISNVR